jgi:GWxTD domain-containing protein
LVLFVPGTRASIGLVLAAALAAPAAAKPVALKSWINGPIRYISERDEAKVFKKLKSDEDRALFIERFWARRDPSPQTLANEYRQLFWERVQEANGLFLDSHKPGWMTDLASIGHPSGLVRVQKQPGWMTDRGKIYILYGPPTRIEDHLDIDTHTDPTAGHGMIRWHYEGRPAGRTDLDPVVIVPFVRETTGEYRVSYDPKLSSVFFDALAVEEQWDRAMDRFLEIFGAPRSTEMSVMLDLGKMQEVPPQAQVLLERVETVESYRTHSIDVNMSRYVHPDGEGIVVVVTADVSHIGEGTNPVAIARFRPHDATRKTRMLGEDVFRVERLDERRVAQSRLLLEPGTYDVTVLVADPATAGTGMHRASLRIPEPTDRLRLSDVIWADELRPLEFASLASHDEPFLIGPFRVVPRIDASFPRGHALRLFYEVYGGVPPYRITYQVEGHDLDGSWVALGKPAIDEQSAAAQGWELATSDAWPLGEYRVRIDVEDTRQRLVSAQLGFHLTEPTPPPGVSGEAPDASSAP